MASQPNANPIAVIRQNLTQMAPELEAALPKHVTVEKFSRVVMTALQNNDSLVNADRKSLFGAVVRLAQDGLLPDGREAAIVMFGNKAQAMPMIAGILKKLRQSGEIAKVSAHVVHENDSFVWSLGFDETVEHNPPALDEPRGAAIGAYATAVLKDGSQLLEVMSLEEIEKVRAVSRAAKNGPWTQWWGEMARKTVMRRLSKRLPMSTDVEETFDRDETLAYEHKVPPLHIVETPPLSRLDAIEHQIDEEQSRSDNGDQSNSSQSPSSSSPPVEGADTVMDEAAGEDQQDGASPAAPSHFEPPSLFEQLRDRLDMAGDMAAVEDVQAEFDAREEEVFLADRPAMQDFINAAIKRVKTGEV